MSLLKHSTKHAFLSETSSPHTLNLLLNLISKKILKKSDIVLILYGNTSSEKSILYRAKLFDFEVLIWDEIKNSNIKFLSLNPFSLTSLNAGIINDFIQKDFVSPSNINFLMQDDEIDRWNKIYNKNGRLVEDESALVNTDVINILNTVNNYIIHYNPWGKVLEKILERDLNIIDAVIPFSVIDYDSEEIFDRFLESRRSNQMKSNTYKILFYTKPNTRKAVLDSLAAISEVVFKNKLPASDKKVIIGLWTNPSYKIQFLQSLLKRLASARKTDNIKIEFQTNMTHEKYLLMLHEYDCLILQPRGGFSTAKYFAEKIGKLITITDSFNDQALQLDYGIKTFNYKNAKDALIAAISSANFEETSEIHRFRSLLAERHYKSNEILKEFWKSM